MDRHLSDKIIETRVQIEPKLIIFCGGVGMREGVLLAIIYNLVL